MKPMSHQDTPKGRGRTSRPSPRELYPEWPHDTRVSAEPADGIVQGFVANLAAFVEAQTGAGVSQAEVCRRAGVAKATLTKVLHGDVWPDSRTVARFETAADVRLWEGPAKHPYRMR